VQYLPVYDAPDRLVHITHVFGSGKKGIMSTRNKSDEKA
jgi:hypothetical protein